MRVSVHPQAAVVTDPGTGNRSAAQAGRAGAGLRQVITTRIAETRYPPFGAALPISSEPAPMTQIGMFCRSVFG